MKNVAGLRNVQVFNSVTSGVLTTPCIYMEVTNTGGLDAVLYTNDFPEQGHATKGVGSQGIPIAAGTTREIPMQVYNFTSTGVVTVVAYTL